jgi:hypothetical protein
MAMTDATEVRRLASRPSRFQPSTIASAVTGAPPLSRCSPSSKVHVVPLESPLHRSARPGRRAPVQSSRTSVSYRWRKANRSARLAGTGAPLRVTG